MSHNRDHGVVFGDLADDLAVESYPVSREALIERYGDRRLEHANGASTFREVLETEMVEEYADADQVRESVMNMVGGDAVGRKNYTDRGTSSGGGDGHDSF